MITPTLVEPTENHEVGVASGVWSLQDQLEARRGGVWPEAGVANPDTLIENNFSTFLYVGNNGTVDVNNNINIDADGGLVWIKRRDDAGNNFLYDTVRSNQQALNSNRTNRDNDGQMLKQSGTGKGFTISGGDQTVNNAKYVSWTFKEIPKFFDIVSYTGSGSAKTVAHSLGSVPGWILVKNLDASEGWHVYHRGVNGGTNPEQYNLRLDSTNAQGDNAGAWNDTAPTSTVFTIGTDDQVNNNGASYIAYLFAHETGDDSMIQCGSYTGNGNATGPVIDLGWEPQWLIVKRSDSTSNWNLNDVMRHMSEVDTKILAANTTGAEGSIDSSVWVPTATGFKVTDTNAFSNANNGTYVYVAIRRPNMATITDATDVFNVLKETSATLNQSYLQQTSFDVDFVINKRFGGASSWWSASRLTNARVQLESNDAETDAAPTHSFDVNNGVIVTGLSGSSSFSGYHFKRAKGFFDVVCYTGTGSARTVAHGLGAVPEMMWVRPRNLGENWAVYHKDVGATKYLQLNTTNAAATSSTRWNDTTPTSSVFSLKADNEVNASSGGPYTYIAFLFATLAGVSKVGSVTHSGSSTDVDCGFSAGARLVMLKRTDASGGWYWWDSARGIIAGNDPYLLLDTTAAEVTNTDYIDPLASGFQISGDFTDGDYIFYAIA
jgi:hypothetical protein